MTPYPLRVKWVKISPLDMRYFREYATFSISDSLDLPRLPMLGVNQCFLRPSPYFTHKKPPSHLSITTHSRHVRSSDNHGLPLPCPGDTAGIRQFPRYAIMPGI